MFTSRRLFCLLAGGTALAASHAAGGWDELGRLPKAQVVKVFLRDGRGIQGTIQRVTPDGLAMVETSGRTEVNLRKVKSTVLSREGEPPRKIEGRPTVERGDIVEIQMRDGQMLQGTVQEIGSGEEVIWLAAANSEIQLGRSDVARVMSKRAGHRRLRNAAIGAAAGAAVLGGSAYAASDPKCRSGVANCTGSPPVAFGFAGALLGAVVGAVIPTRDWTPIYESR